MDIKLPVLSLTGSDPGYDPNIYLGGVIVVPEAAPGQRRELLVPVYIRNCWVPANDPVYGKVWPIYSLDFKFKYDGQLLEFVGLQKVGPRGDSVLAKDFAFSFDDARITSSEMLGALVRWHNLGSSVPSVGQPRRVRIVASSAKPLPPSPAFGQDPWDPTVQCDQRQFVPLIYLRFRVTGVQGSQGFLILSNDTLKYNDLDLAQFPAEPFPGNPSGQRYRDYVTYRSGGAFGDVAYEGLGGVDNRGLLPAANQWTSMPGVAHLYITAIPEIGFEPRVGINAVVRQVSADEWEVVEPIVLDSASQLRGVFYGRRELVVTNEEPRDALDRRCSGIECPLAEVPNLWDSESDPAHHPSRGHPLH
jgi:hypothetical protein